jgi:nucleoredoxin
MKTILNTLLATAFLMSTAAANFESWTNKEGREARMKLVEVVRDGDKITGKFELENGRTINLDADALSEADAKRLAEWEPAPPEPTGSPSVFDEMLAGNLVRLDGREFVEHTMTEKPEKYYVFYYTASWCPPCQAYTPDLVRFYNRERRKGNHFELILVTSDRNEDAMLEYARDKKMPWPHVTFSKRQEINGKLDHGVRGIPAVIVCDLEGNVISRDRDIRALGRALSQ